MTDLPDFLSVLQETAAEIGWVIALPKDETISNLIVGTEESVHEKLVLMYGEDWEDYYEILANDDNISKELH